ncbi:MAG: diguanylate cyclase, partial [Candidatus Acidiferrales bacterium]
MSRHNFVFRRALVAAGAFFLYLLLNRPEIILVSQLGFTAWFPASGLVLAVLLSLDPWFAPVFVAADIIASHWMYHQPLLSWTSTAGAVGGTGLYLAAAVVLRKHWKIDWQLRTPQDVFRYLSVSSIAAVAATAVGVGCLVADHTILPSQFWASSIAWYIGDAIGLLGFAPFLLVYVLPWIHAKIEVPKPEGADPRDRRVHSSDLPQTVREIIEAFAQGLTLFLAIWLMFGPEFGDRQLYYLSFVPIVWIAASRGMQRVVIGLLALNFGIIIALRFFPPVPNVLDRLGFLMLVLSATGLLLGAIVSERLRMQLELRSRTAYINSLIENNPLGIVVLDRAGRVQLCNNAFERLFLFSRAEIEGKKIAVMICAPNEISDSEKVSIGRVVQRTVRCLRKDQTLVDVEVHEVPLVVDREVRGAYFVYKDITEQIYAAEQAARNAESLKRWVGELQLRTKEMKLLNEMGDMLQSCATASEAYTIAGRAAEKLFPYVVTGQYFVFKSSRNALEAAASWGVTSTSEKVFPPRDCWALRRGKIHWSTTNDDDVKCPHLKGAPAGRYLCVPMVAQGEALGILNLHYDLAVAGEVATVGQSWHEAREQLATTVSGQVALALASLRLRETLQDQSIRDPLTRMYNRRFMEESLDRELQRARRSGQSLVVGLMDLDHFKSFNDTHGHDAGDAVLRQMGDLFQSFFRGVDIVCRYGGEEFAVIMLDSTVAQVADRVGDLMAKVRDIDVMHKSVRIGPITISMGLSEFPADAGDAEGLLKIAD